MKYITPTHLAFSFVAILVSISSCADDGGGGMTTNGVVTGGSTTSSTTDTGTTGSSTTDTTGTTTDTSGTGTTVDTGSTTTTTDTSGTSTTVDTGSTTGGGGAGGDGGGGAGGSDTAAGGAGGTGGAGGAPGAGGGAGGGDDMGAGGMGGHGGMGGGTNEPMDMPDDMPADGPPPTFDTLKEVLASNLGCLGSCCHGGDIWVDFRITDELYTTLTTETSDGCEGLPLVDPGNPEGSALVRLIKEDCGEIQRMPAGCIQNEFENSCVPDNYIAAIEQWVADGAPME